MGIIITKIVLFLTLVFFVQGTPSSTSIHPDVKTEPTGLYLDELSNEVILLYENGKPILYYSNIFTPVCKSGECMPIYINIYWDLMGNYVRFDQPEGEILTKLDHVPFTDDDYQLLDEILHGEDPRFGLAVKHSSPSPSESQSQPEPLASKKENPSVPAPPIRMLLKKTQMVDAITGATLPEQENKFVPGALYTTYTVWDLANTHTQVMADYTETNLFLPELYNHLLTDDKFGCRSRLIQTLTPDTENGQANLFMSILDTTSNASLATYCAGGVSYYDLQLDTVQNTYCRVFFSDAEHVIRRKVLQKWSGSTIIPEGITKLAKSLNTQLFLFQDILWTLKDCETWPSGTVAELVQQMKLQPLKENKNAIYDVLLARKESISKSDWDLVKAAK
jgi:hypothetical protein